MIDDDGYRGGRFNCAPSPQELFNIADQLSIDHPDWSLVRCDQRAVVVWYLTQEKE